MKIILSLIAAVTVTINVYLVTEAWVKTTRTIYEDLDKGEKQPCRLVPIPDNLGPPQPVIRAFKLETLDA